jgi:hypothetical protein
MIALVAPSVAESTAFGSQGREAQILSRSQTPRPAWELGNLPNWL